MNDVEKLLESLELVNKLIEDGAIKAATNEQILDFIELTNKLKALIISNLD